MQNNMYNMNNMQDMQDIKKCKTNALLYAELEYVSKYVYKYAWYAESRYAKEYAIKYEKTNMPKKYTINHARKYAQYANK